LRGIDLKMLVSAGKGRGLFGIVKGKVTGQLIGGRAQVRTSAKSPTLYLRLADPTKIEEVVLVALRTKGGQRELEFSSEGGEKGGPRLKVEVMRQFDATEVGARLFRITTKPLAAGEYMVYLVGSADPEKGIQGKGYDFGVD
jgi:hypothetical protein